MLMKLFLHLTSLIFLISFGHCEVADEFPYYHDTCDENQYCIAVERMWKTKLQTRWINLLLFKVSDETIAILTGLTIAISINILMCYCNVTRFIYGRRPQRPLTLREQKYLQFRSTLTQLNKRKKYFDTKYREAIEMLKTRTKDYRSLPAIRKAENAHCNIDKCMAELERKLNCDTQPVSVGEVKTYSKLIQKAINDAFKFVRKLKQVCLSKEENVEEMLKYSEVVKDFIASLKADAPIC